MRKAILEEGMVHESLTEWAPGRKVLEAGNSFNIIFSVKGSRKGRSS